jgi:hypothetical protein
MDRPVGAFCYFGGLFFVRLHEFINIAFESLSAFQ